MNDSWGSEEVNDDNEPIFNNVFKLEVTWSVVEWLMYYSQYRGRAEAILLLRI
jgi:hypothetical protein